MESEWRQTTLGSLTEWTSGGTPSKQEPNYWNGDIPWISAVSMKTTRLYNSELKITSSGLYHGSRLAKARSVLLLVRGSELHKRIPIGIAMKPLAFNQDVKALKARDGLLPEFLLYWLLGNEKNLLNKVEHTGIGAGKLDMGVLKNLSFYLPNLSEQHAIVYILSTIDDKIELNRRMNETLEAMSRALFKSWFVDFDPMRAKAEGRWKRGQSLPNLPEHLYDLFPDRLVDSELGEIPEGWEAGTFGDVAKNPRRGIQPGQIELNTPYIALEHMPKRCIALSDWGTAEGLESNKFEFRAGEILFGKLRPYFHKVGVAPVDGVCSTDIVVVAPKLEQWFGFVLGHVSSEVFVEYTNAGSTGTKMPRTSWGDMAHYAIVVPPEPVATVFTNQLRPAVDRIISRIHESRTLAALRDTLLPKLISGELRVNK